MTKPITYVVALFIAMITIPIHAVTYTPHNFNDVIKKSDLVVEGTIIDTYIGLDKKGKYHSYYNVEVSEFIKGQTNSNIIRFDMCGGTIGNIDFVCSGAPVLDEGDKGIFALGKSEGIHTLMYGSSGVYLYDDENIVRNIHDKRLSFFNKGKAYFENDFDRGTYGDANFLKSYIETLVSREEKLKIVPLRHRQFKDTIKRFPYIKRAKNIEDFKALIEKSPNKLKLLKRWKEWAGSRVKDGRIRKYREKRLNKSSSLKDQMIEALNDE